MGWVTLSWSIFMLGTALETQVNILPKPNKGCKRLALASLPQNVIHQHLRQASYLHIFDNELELDEDN